MKKSPSCSTSRFHQLYYYFTSSKLLTFAFVLTLLSPIWDFLVDRVESLGFLYGHAGLLILGPLALCWEVAVGCGAVPSQGRPLCRVPVVAVLQTPQPQWPETATVISVISHSSGVDWAPLGASGLASHRGWGCLENSFPLSGS